MNLKEEISKISGSEQVIVTVEDSIRETMAYLVFQEDSLNYQLQSIRDNRYGFYNRDSVIKILTAQEDKRLERIKFIQSVGESLLGENYQAFLNENNLAFQIDTGVPVIVFFKVN